MHRLLIIFISMLSFGVASTETVVSFPAVENNVPYSKVAALMFSEADEKIAYGTTDSQFALLWRAKQVAHNRQRQPLVILIHGGCWLSSYDIKHTYPLSTALAQQGFNVWSLEYRRSGATGGGWPTTFDDIKAGIHAASSYNQGEFNLAEAVAVGHSAGGHLALLAGGVFSELRAVIGLAAITDIKAYANGENSCQQATKDFMQGMPEEKPLEYTLANPSEQPLHANSVILHGNKDTVVPAYELNKLNRTVIMLDGVGHFDWIHPGSLAVATLIQNLTEI